jgi:hypothetical protein
MTRAERVLSVVLCLFAAPRFLALVPVLMPFSWMDRIHQALDMGVLPTVPVVEYLARSCSVFYALHGALFIFLATNVRRFLPVIRFLAWAGVIFGLIIFGVDHEAGLPGFWRQGEGAVIVAESVVLLWLVRRAVAGQHPPSKHP